MKDLKLQDSGENKNSLYIFKINLFESFHPDFFCPFSYSKVTQSNVGRI